MDMNTAPLAGVAQTVGTLYLLHWQPEGYNTHPKTRAFTSREERTQASAALGDLSWWEDDVPVEGDRFAHIPSSAFAAERPWCGWMTAFAAESDWDTTGFGLEKLVGINFLLTTADGHSRPVRMLHWQWIESVRDGAPEDRAGIEVTELDTEHYEPLTPARVSKVRYEDIREIVVF